MKVMSIGNSGIAALDDWCSTSLPWYTRKKTRLKKIALCSMIIAVLCEEEEEEITRKEWCKDWLHKRNERGSHATIFQELRTGYESDFTNY